MCVQYVISVISIFDMIVYTSFSAVLSFQEYTKRNIITNSFAFEYFANGHTTMVRQPSRDDIL